MRLRPHTKEREALMAEKHQKGFVTISFSLISLLLSACSSTATMVPVEGPLSRVRPVPVLLVEVNGIMGNSGSLSTLIPPGDLCTGRWSSAAGSGLTVVTGGLISTYGSIYGFGTATTSQGQNEGRALLICSSGRTIDVEFITGAGTANGFGIGKDNEGNIYKLVF